MAAGALSKTSEIVATAGVGNRTDSPPDGSAGSVGRRLFDSWTSRRAEVVAIGISTGGPPALTYLLPQLPADLAVPVLIVQHMPPIFTRSMADDLDRRCALRVCEVAVCRSSGRARLDFIAPGGKHMKIEQGDPSPIVRITDDPPENSCQPSVDYLFRQWPRDTGRRVLGVLMTGMGNECAVGCCLLHRYGARCCWPKRKTVASFMECRGNRFKRVSPRPSR